MGVSRIDNFTFGLLTVASGNPSVAPVAYNGPVNGAIMFVAFGTFGGGTVTLEMTIDGTNWVAVPGVSLTAAGSVYAQVVALGLRPKITGATSPSVTTQIALVDFGG